MQTALENGDFLLTPQGLPRALVGEEATLQEILIRLSVRKGQFPLDSALGSELYTLTAHTGDPAAFALDAARRALAPMRGVTVEAAEITLDRARDGAVAVYTLRLEGISRQSTRQLEVAIG